MSDDSGRGSDRVTELVAAARAGVARAAARLISLVEDNSVLLPQVMAELAPYVGGAQVIGITGSPGVGKSTTTSALVAQLRTAGQRVGVLAIDPSSPFSGGALLGDRIRMTEHAADPNVFIRSMASRGQLGGVSASTPQALRVLDAAGFDTVLIETVGVGQSEVEIATLADSTLVLLAPGMGDGIQAAKAGILEIGDVFAVNKADREGAHQVVRELRGMLSLSERRDGSWRQPVLTMSAANHTGVAEVLDALGRHRQWLTDTGELQRRRLRRARLEIEAIAVGQLREQWRAIAGGLELDQLAQAVCMGELDPYAAAASLRSAPARTQQH